MSGSTGLVGSALKTALERQGWRVTALTTSPSLSKDSVFWNPCSEEGVDSFLQNNPLSQHKYDALIHLGGYPLQPLWTKRMKRLVYESRVNGSRMLSDSILRAPAEHKPSTFICTSAVGFYGTPPSNYQGPAFTEDTTPYNSGTFLGSVSSDSEHACDSVRDQTRVVHPRLGVVLAAHGGAFPTMALPYKFGLGGPMGPGTQIFPFVGLVDVVNAFVFCLNESVQGPVNVVAPNLVSQGEFAKTMGKILNRPTFIPTPAFALRSLLGSDAADAMLLASIKVQPQVLLKHGFQFEQPQLEPLLRSILQKQAD